jgi:hypothetical protein
MTGRVELLTLRVDAGADAEAQELDRLARELRHELEELDVRSATLAVAAAAPEGARAGAVAELATVAIELARSPELLAAVMAVVQAWLGRRTGRSVRLELDGDVLDVSGVSSADQRQLIAGWLRRHGGEPARAR